VPIRLGILALAAAAALNCSHRSPPASELGLPPPVVLAPGAFDVRPEKKDDGRRGVTYRLREAFPADALLGRINNAMPPPGWQPLAMDWLNPDIPSSHQSGWRDWRDGTKTPPTRVHQWSAQWRDSQGNIVFYELRYDLALNSGGGRLGPPDNDNVRITAVWIPTSAAQRMMEWSRSIRRVPKTP
jgi:hypothetical protein